jgi:hypothetical protein
MAAPCNDEQRSTRLPGAPAATPICWGRLLGQAPGREGKRAPYLLDGLAADRLVEQVEMETAGRRDWSRSRVD